MYWIDKSKLDIFASFLKFCFQSCFENELLAAKFKIGLLTLHLSTKAFKYNPPLTKIFGIFQKQYIDVLF